MQLRPLNHAYGTNPGHQALNVLSINILTGHQALNLVELKLQGIKPPTMNEYAWTQHLNILDHRPLI
ncbi:hypothetical protein MTR_4g113445 [Medicago truncatula]|uniref:Uncharacterized protein n=1 Tax=Medicago truncatula TaxID=3880 RepID=A0A072V1V6_MEDTR|nr:hypothetical protein MTR_4g113445 [Medicago truncatula]